MKSILLKNKILYLDKGIYNNPINLNYFKSKRNYLNESLNNKYNEISYNNNNNNIPKKYKLKHIKLKTLNNLTISNFDFINNKLNKENNYYNNLNKRVSLNKKEKIKIVSKDKINKLKLSLINKNNNNNNITIENYSYRNNLNITKDNNNFHTLEINKNFDSIDNKNNPNQFNKNNNNNNKIDKNNIKRKKKYYLKIDNNKLNLSNYFYSKKDNNYNSKKVNEILKLEDDTIDDILYGNKKLNNTDDFNILHTIIKKLKFNNINMKDNIFNTENDNNLYEDYKDIFETKFNNFKKLYK